MLQTMRALSKTWVFKGLMLVLGVSFAIWGIGDMFRGNPQQRAVAKAGSATITVQELERAFQNALPEARRVFGPELTAQQARQMGVLERTLNLMIEHALFDQEASRLGLAVPDSAILTKIAAESAFRDKDGKFNTQLWRQALAKSGTTERAFLDTQRQDVARQMLYQAVVADAKPSQVMIDHLTRARGAKRVLEVLTLENKSIPAKPVDEATLQDYFQKQAEIFTAPELRGITIARLATADIAKDIVFSEEDLRAAYEARKGELATPEQRDLVQLVTPDEAKAKAAAEAAKKGGNLAAAAKAKGLTTATLNRLDEKSILPDLYTTVFALEEGQVSDPIKTDLGWHVVQVKAVHAAGTPSYAEARDKLRDTLQQEQSGDAITRRLNQLEDALAAGQPLEDVADSMRLRLIKIPALNAQGLTPEGQAPEELPAKDEVLRAAFGQAAGETSGVLDDRNGNSIVVRTDAVTPATLKPFASVKAQVVELWTREQQDQAAEAKAEEIAKAVREGKKLDSFKQAGSFRLSSPISQLGAMDEALPPSALQDILRLKRGEVMTTKGTGRHYVLRLATITPVDPKEPASGRAEVEDQLTQDVSYERLEQYSKALHDRFPVRIKEDVVEMLKKQGG